MINKKELPFVSIITVNYNGKQHLNECFNSLKDLNYPKDNYEVIMVDNNSTDDSIKYTKQEFPWVKILKLDKNYGFAKGNNEGVKISKGDFIAFLNNDTVVDKKWLLELIKPTLTNENIKVCGSKEYIYGTKNQIRTFGGFFTNTGGGTRLTKISKSKEKIFDIGYSAGSSMLINKKIFLKLEGFDEDYFMYNEEVDLCWRVWLSGFRCVVNTKAKILHKEGNFSKKREKFLVHVYKNQILTMLKNFQLKNLFINLGIFLLYDISQIVKYCILFKFKNIINLMKSHIIVLKLAPQIIKKRKKVKNIRKISDKFLYKKGLIISNLEGIKREMGIFRREYVGR